MEFSKQYFINEKKYFLYPFYMTVINMQARDSDFISSLLKDNTWSEESFHREIPRGISITT